jgi:predicted permease
LVETLRAAPGVTAVAVGSDAPLRGSSNASILFAEGRPDDRMRYYWHSVTPGYFATLGIDLVRGRGFEPSDDADAPRVVIVSEAFAAKLWPGRDGVGRYLELGQGRERATVIGVAANVRFRDLTSDLFSAGEDPDVWFPYPQRPSTTLEILVRSGTSDLVPADVVQRAIAGLDPSVPLVRAQPLADVLGEQTGSARFGSVILALFAGLALVLCGIGLYGVMAFFVASRRPEIAVRMALGAKQAQVLAMIVRQGMALVGIGVIAGLAAVVAGARLAASLLFGVSPADPLVHVSCLALLATIALAACLLPAWRATRIDPTEALRAE